MTEDLQKYYSEALDFTRNHYENFPVASYFFPKELQKHIAVVYRFAREADDFADEERYAGKDRIALLQNHEDKLKNALENETTGYWAALANTISEKKLSPDNFFNLISAFKQDVVKSDYENYDNILDYCSRSANPVGRIILELFGFSNELNIQLSDKICTALQLTNFWQDVGIDIQKERVYLPLDEMKSFGVKKTNLSENSSSENLKKLIKFQVERTNDLFAEGRKLVNNLKGRLKLQIKLTILGGEMILQKIADNNYDVLKSRPKIKKNDYIVLLIKSMKKFDS